MNPVITEKKISYSVGMKLNMGNYQSADVHVSETETIDVSMMNTVEEIEAYVKLRYDALKEKIDDQFMESIKELKDDKTTA